MIYPRALPASLVTTLAVFSSILHTSSAFSTPAASTPSSTYTTIQGASSLLDPTTGKELSSSILSSDKKKTLVVVLPQLGEFDSSEYCEFLVAAEKSLEENNINLQVVGIGDTTAAQNFCDFTGLSPQRLSIDPNGDLHEKLNLHKGPNFSIPEGVSDE